jgi:homoserine kinase
VLGAFLSGAGPSVALLARHNLPRVERLLASLYERAGVAATVRTLAVHENSAGSTSRNPAYATDAMASARGRAL